LRFAFCAEFLLLKLVLPAQEERSILQGFFLSSLPESDYRSCTDPSHKHLQLGYNNSSRDWGVNEVCKCKPYRTEIQSLSVVMTGGSRYIKVSPSTSRIGIGMMTGYMASPPEAMVNGNRRRTGRESNRGCICA